MDDEPTRIVRVWEDIPIMAVAGLSAALAAAASLAPAWTFGTTAEAGVFRTNAAATNGTSAIRIYDIAADGTAGWFYFLTQYIGVPPFVLRMKGARGVAVFRVSAITDNGDGSALLAVEFKNGISEDWADLYELGIAPVGGTGATLAAIEAIFAALPTGDPLDAGKLWNNGGVPSISEG